MEEQEIRNIPRNFVDEETGSVYIYGEFDETIQLNVIPKLVRLISKAVGQKNPLPINIYIDSPGGQASVLHSLLTVITKAQEEGLKIVTIVTGEAGSCASLLACYGNHRLMWDYSYHVVHYGSAYSASRTPLQQERMNQWAKRHFNSVISMYKNHSKLDESKLKELLADDCLILSPETCLKYGLCDEVISDSVVKFEDTKVEFERKSSKNENNIKIKSMDEKSRKSTKKRKISSNSSSR